MLQEDAQRLLLEECKQKLTISRELICLALDLIEEINEGEGLEQEVISPLKTAKQEIDAILASCLFETD